MVYIRANSPIIHFLLLVQSRRQLRLRGFQESTSFISPPTLLTLYALLGVIGESLVGGVVDDVALSLAGGVGAGGGGTMYYVLCTMYYVLCTM